MFQTETVTTSPLRLWHLAAESTIYSFRYEHVQKAHTKSGISEK